MYGEKIKTIRELRGFSQVHMASQLGIEQNTYSKIETGQTKLKADTLKHISEILGVSPVDILSNQPTIINFQSHQDVQTKTEPSNMYHRDFIDKMVASKDIEIQHLKEIIAGLLKDKEMMLDYFKK